MQLIFSNALYNFIFIQLERVALQPGLMYKGPSKASDFLFPLCQYCGSAFNRQFA